MPIPCARCEMPLPHWELATGGAAVCTSCGSRNQARAFPALFARAEAVIASAAVEGEATCYDHPAKRAAASCSQCGRFVCTLCSVEMHGSIWCPSCVAAGAGNAKAARTETSRTLFDSIALILPIGSLILWPATVIAAPASLVLTAMKWKQPLSIVRRTRWRFLLAILFSLAEIGGWTWLIVYLVMRARGTQ